MIRFKLFPLLQFGRFMLLPRDTIMPESHIIKRLNFFNYLIDFLLMISIAGFGMNVA